MKIAVIGAGVVGVTTAHALAADGHQVTVFERRGSVAAGASFAHAGLVAASDAELALAGGGVAALSGRSLTLRGPTRGLLPWAWQRWRQRRSAADSALRRQSQRLAEFSRARLNGLVRELALGHEQSEGLLVLLRTPRLHAQAERLLADLERDREDDRPATAKLLDADACRAIEPGLNEEAPLHGGIHLPGEQVGNCREFSHLLRQEAQRLGVRFRLHTAVERIVTGVSPQLVHLCSPPREPVSLHSTHATPPDAQDTQPMAMERVTEGFDAVVVCTGPEAAALLRPLGLALPMQAVHGYSITAPLRHHEGHPDLGPRSAVIDAARGVSISRLGSRLRVAGGAEIGGHPEELYPKALSPLYEALHDWFPGSARMTQAQRWKGARPTLPDGAPLLGASGSANVWLNLGHGGNGWAMACGSARLIADAIAGRPPAVAIDALGVGRLKA